MNWAIAVHGGAGDWARLPQEAGLVGVRRAVEMVRALLGEGRPALEAVTAAVVALEDDPVFNAGTGSVFNSAGDVEMDASVMTGHDLRFGAVAAIRRVRNPVLVARRVMEGGMHALLVGEGAVQFARAQGFGDYDPATPRAHIEWASARAGSPLGTVGAVAVDSSGRLAAATSTGGTFLKLPGRVGDTPLPGAGTYVTDKVAVSATGKGELIMRTLAAKRICDLVDAGVALRAAAHQVLAEMGASIGADAGFIAVGRDGSIGMAHGTPHMVHAFATASAPGIVARLSVED